MGISRGKSKAQAEREALSPFAGMRREFALAAVISSAAAISQSTISLNEAALFPEDI